MPGNADRGEYPARIARSAAPRSSRRLPGNRESGAPIYTFGGRIQYSIGPLELGVTAKRTGPRYVNDMNLPLFLCTNAAGGNAYINTLDCGATATPNNQVRFQVYGARTPAYNIVNLDARLTLGWAGLNDDTFLQLNVTNLFDVRYAGNFGGQLLNTSVPFVQLGAPRAVVGTLVVGFR